MTSTQTVTDTPKSRTKSRTKRTNGSMEPGRPTMVALSDIRMDPEYQRPLDVARVEAIVAGYDPLQVNAAHLSSRGRSLHCVDGQHTVEALRRLGLTAIPAIIHEGLSQREEAGLFIRINRARKTLGAWDWYRASIVAGDLAALEVRDVMSRSMFSFSPDKGNKTNIDAVGAVRRIHKHGKKSLLRATLSYLEHHWYGHQGATAALAMEGLALFLQSERPDPVFDEKRLATAMNRIGPAAFKLEAAEWAAVEKGQRLNVHWMANYFQHVYNQGVSKASLKLTGHITRR